MSKERSRNESGQYVSERPPDTILGVMEEFEPYTTGELAETVDWPRRTTYEVLDRLAESDTIRKKKPDPRRAIWMYTGDV